MELPAAFSQRIKSTPLTAKEALVAEYILNNFLSVCYVSTSELARILGVSDATVSRTSPLSVFIPIRAWMPRRIS